MLLTPAQIKPTLFESRQNSLFSFFFFFLPRVDAPHVYVRVWALGCFCSPIQTPSAAVRHLPPRKDVVNQCLEFGLSHISTRTFRRALTASVDSCAEIKSAPSVAYPKLARVWKKVPESNARSLEDGAGKRCSECAVDSRRRSSRRKFFPLTTSRQI